jgi:hypothetical protein
VDVDSVAWVDACAGADSVACVDSFAASELRAGADRSLGVAVLAGVDSDADVVDSEACGACAGGFNAAGEELVEESLLVEEDAPVCCFVCPRALFALAAVAEPLFTVALPGNACAATSVSRPVRTTLLASSTRFTRPNLRSAASRVLVVWLVMFAGRRSCVMQKVCARRLRIG